jgi:hypothetical protein
MDFIDELAGLTIEMMNQVSYNHDWIRGKGDYNILEANILLCYQGYIRNKNSYKNKINAAYHL